MSGLDQSNISLLVYGMTDQGRQRSDNQDSFLVADLSVEPSDGGLLLNPEAVPADGARLGTFPLGPKGALVLVADGMGGAVAGATASRLATSWIYYELVSKWTADHDNTPRQFASRLREAVEAANQRIHDEASRRPECLGMGTTATATGILDNILYLAQVGDSRAYLVRGGEVHQLTRDQSMVQALVEAGALTEEEAEGSAYRNMILQALGTGESVQVDLTYQELRRGDLVLLCSDGLSRMVRKDEIAYAVANIPDLPSLCEALIDLANSRGGPDNITVVVARAEGAGLGDPATGGAVGRNVYVLPEP